MCQSFLNTDFILTWLESKLSDFPLSFRTISNNHFTEIHRHPPLEFFTGNTEPTEPVGLPKPVIPFLQSLETLGRKVGNKTIGRLSRLNDELEYLVALLEKVTFSLSLIGKGWQLFSK